MTRNFKYAALDENFIETVVFITDYEIILTYWCWWSNEVFTNRPENSHLITVDECIQDFVYTHWATEVFNHSWRHM